MRNKVSWSLTCVCAAVTLATGLIGAAQQPPLSNPPRVSLQITVVLAKKGPTLAFTMKNNSRSPVEIYGPDAAPSRITIVTPTGEEVEHFASVDPAPGAALPSVAPGEIKTWQRDMTSLLVETDRFTTPGVYKIYWKYLHREGNGPLVVYKSNEIPILREEDTPVISPYTGREVPRKDRKK